MSVHPLHASPPLPVIGASWRDAAPLDAAALWEASRLRPGPMIDDAGRRRFRLRNFLNETRLTRGDGRRPCFASVIVEVHPDVIDDDLRFHGGEGLTHFLSELTKRHDATFGPNLWPRGPARYAVRAHDGAEIDRVNVFVGPGASLPHPGDDPEGALDAAFVDAESRVAPLLLPEWLCLNRDGDGLIKRPVAIYPDNDRLLLGFDSKSAGIVFANVPVAAEGTVFVDLGEVRSGWSETGSHEIVAEVIGGTVRLRAERLGKRETAPDPRPAPSVPSPFSGIRDPIPKHLRRGPAPLNRVEPYLEAPERRASAKLSVPDRPDRVEDGPTIVLPRASVFNETTGAGGRETIVVRPRDHDDIKAKAPIRPRLTATRIALARVDGRCRSSSIDGWTLEINADGMPRHSHGGGTAVVLAAEPNRRGLLIRSPDGREEHEVSLDDGEPATPDSLLVFERVPPDLAARYHAFLRLPVPVTLTLVEGMRHRLGRAGGSPSSGSAPKLSFGLLEAPGSLRGQDDPDAALEDIGLSRDHLFVTPVEGQLHIVQARGRAPVWKLAENGSVAPLDPDSPDELILIHGESVVMGGYVAMFHED